MMCCAIWRLEILSNQSFCIFWAVLDSCSIHIKSFVEWSWKYYAFKYWQMSWLQRPSPTPCCRILPSCLVGELALGQDLPNHGLSWKKTSKSAVPSCQNHFLDVSLILPVSLSLFLFISLISVLSFSISFVGYEKWSWSITRDGARSFFFSAMTAFYHCGSLLFHSQSIAGAAAPSEQKVCCDAFSNADRRNQHGRPRHLQVHSTAGERSKLLLAPGDLCWDACAMPGCCGSCETVGACKRVEYSLGNLI